MYSFQRRHCSTRAAKVFSFVRHIQLTNRLDSANIKYEITDKRTNGRSIDVSFNGKLRDSQAKAVDTMLKYDMGILHAATAFGKTVVCCDIIAKHKVNTLILVDRTDLMNQWINRLEEFLTINE